MLGCAVIGASGISKAYLQAIERLPQVQCHYLFSHSLDRATNTSAKYKGVKPVAQMDAILEDPRVSFVIICNEPTQHLSTAIACLKANKNILLEKPLAHSLSEATEFLRLAKSSSNTLAVVSQKRFDPILLAMRKNLEDRKLKALSAKVRIAWRRDEDYYHHGTGWRLEHSPVMVNQAIHWIDVLQWFFGKPIKIEAHSECQRPFLKCPDYSKADIIYDTGAMAEISATTNVSESIPDSFSVQTPYGDITYAEFQKKMDLDRRFSQIFRRNNNKWNLIQQQVKDFVESIEKKREPSTTLDDGFEALKTALEISKL